MIPEKQHIVEAIDRLIEMYQGKIGMLLEGRAMIVGIDDGLQQPPKKKYRHAGIAKHIKKILGAGPPETEWTTTAMVAALRADGRVLPEKYPQALAANVFTQLRKKNILTIIHQGSGKYPNIYRYVPHAHNE